MADDTRVGLGVQPEPSNWLTPRDLQTELKIGERLAYRLLQDGSIPSVRVGGLYRIPRSRLEEALGVHSDLGQEA